MSRRQVIREQLVAFYLSARREQPEAKQLDVEIGLAMKDWEDIPTASLVEICAAARKQAGEYMATNGLVVKVWSERQKAHTNRFRPFPALEIPSGSLPDPDELRAFGATMARAVKSGTIGEALKGFDWGGADASHHDQR